MAIYNMVGGGGGDSFKAFLNVSTGATAGGSRITATNNVTGKVFSTTIAGGATSAQLTIKQSGTYTVTATDLTSGSSRTNSGSVVFSDTGTTLSISLPYEIDIPISNSTWAIRSGGAQAGTGTITNGNIYFNNATSNVSATRNTTDSTVGFSTINFEYSVETNGGTGVIAGGLANKNTAQMLDPTAYTGAWSGYINLPAAGQTGILSVPFTVQGDYYISVGTRYNSKVNITRVYLS